MIEYTPRNPATITPPSAGNYRFFCTEDGNFARMDSEGNVSTLPFATDIPGQYELPQEIAQRKILAGLIDGAMIGPSCQFQNGGATLAALGLAYTSNANGRAISFTIGSQPLVLQWGQNYSGSDTWSANYSLPVEFGSYAAPDAVIVAVRNSINPTAADGNAIGARLVSTTQFQIGQDDFNARLCNWIAIGPGVS